MKPFAFLLLTVAALFAFTVVPLAAEQPAADPTDHADHAMPAPVSHPLLDRFKALEGRWEGTMTSEEDGAQPQPVAVEYRVTAGGSAVLETIFPGTPMEMISVYFVDGDQLKMTHYCLAQNQPTLIGSAGDTPDIVELKFDHATNMPDPNAMHMRNATVEFLGPDHYRSYGEGYVNGEPMPEGCGVMDMRRVEARG